MLKIVHSLRTDWMKKNNWLMQRLTSCKYFCHIWEITYIKLCYKHFLFVCVRIIGSSNLIISCHWRLGWVGKVRSLRAPHLGSNPAARRSPLVGVLSGVTSHTVVQAGPRDWATPFEAIWRPARGCNIAIKAPIFQTQKNNNNNNNY